MPVRRAFVLVAVALAAPLSAGARPDATPATVIDRTLLCSTVSDFGERVLRVWMTSPKSVPTGDVPASSSVGTGSAGTIQSLAGLAAGPGGGRATGSASYNKSRCQLSTKNVPLTSRGLPGPPVPFDQFQRCKVGARVLVRVRAVVDRKVAWRVVRRDFMEAIGNMSTAALAVRTEAGKPLVFFRFESGTTWLWTVGSCTH